MSRSFSTILKENSVLAAGIALPVLLILLFTIARVIPERSVPAPQYKAVYATQDYPAPFKFEVKEGKLAVSYTKPKETYELNRQRKDVIFIYDPAGDSIETETLEIPTTSDTKPLPIKIAKFEKLKLSSDVKAPDGYEFKEKTWNSGSLVTEIFSSRSRYSPERIEKDGRSIPLRTSNNDIYGDVTFIGWVIPE